MVKPARLDCRFVAHEPRGVRECRVNPPVPSPPTPVGPGYAVAVWPRVESYDWCAKFEPTQQAVEEDLRRQSQGPIPTLRSPLYPEKNPYLDIRSLSELERNLDLPRDFRGLRPFGPSSPAKAPEPSPASPPTPSDSSPASPRDSTSPTKPPASSPASADAPSPPPSNSQP